MLSQSIFIIKKIFKNKDNLKTLIKSETIQMVKKIILEKGFK